jgi:2-C-methyl-D-erythritol 4-phosphate cytidylyltransferase
MIRVSSAPSRATAFGARRRRRCFALPGHDGFTDEAQAVEASGRKARVVRGSALNVKITFPDDLALATAILTMQSP